MGLVPRLMDVRVLTTINPVRTAPIMPNRTDRRKVASMVLFKRDARIIPPASSVANPGAG
jgi:hypothetical protein